MASHGAPSFAHMLGQTDTTGSPDYARLLRQLGITPSIAQDVRIIGVALKTSEHSRAEGWMTEVIEAIEPGAWLNDHDITYRAAWAMTLAVIPAASEPKIASLFNQVLSDSEKVEEDMWPHTLEQISSEFQDIGFTKPDADTAALHVAVFAAAPGTATRRAISMAFSFKADYPYDTALRTPDEHVWTALPLKEPIARLADEPHYGFPPSSCQDEKERSIILDRICDNFLAELTSISPYLR